VLNARSLRFRLAVWYFVTVAVICALAASGYWFAIRSELNHALDQGLRYRLIGLREFLEDVEPRGNQEITSRLNEISGLGELYQVFGADGTRQFTADASHELRAPMTLIYTAAQYSLRRERSREELVDSMRKILRESQRTTALIDDLLLLARGDAGKESAALEIIDAGPLLRDAAEQATAMAAAKGISVSLHVEADALPVRADEIQLRRLLLILIDNAIKYTPGGGRVAIDGLADASAVTISVTDTGTGIRPEDLPHVFERFWRADKVRSREAGGAGLGLTIAKQIAQLQGADLSVQSEVDRGSTFQIRFGNPAP